MKRSILIKKWCIILIIIRENYDYLLALGGQDEPTLGLIVLWLDLYASFP